jgi:hypothetical protein
MLQREINFLKKEKLFLMEEHKEENKMNKVEQSPLKQPF